MKYSIDDYTIIAPSIKKFKKYDVYYKNKYLLSYGDIRYNHYYDKFGYYSYLNHNDPERRLLYRKRHHNDHIHNPNYSGYWSYNFLW